MKKILYIYILIIALCLCSIIYILNRNADFKDDFTPEKAYLAEYDHNLPSSTPTGLSSEYPVIPYGTDINADMFRDSSYAALLVNNDTKKPIVAYNAFRRIYPASTTKLMTALVVCDAISAGKFNLNDEVTLEHNISFSVEGAVASGLRSGCTITVRNLLFGLMIRSYNDYAVILAEYTAGDIESFADLMNKKAAEIGATGSHFVNPHGLHADDHYITAYDMYLIINEASKYDILREIDTYDTYSYTYKDPAGNEVTDDISPTNLFLAGSYTLPSNIEITEWKTGTTRLAGNVLTMVAKIDGQEYTMFLADSVSSADLYNKYTLLFNLTKDN